jgi:glucosylceramidase
MFRVHTNVPGFALLAAMLGACSILVPTAAGAAKRPKPPPAPSFAQAYLTTADLTSALTPQAPLRFQARAPRGVPVMKVNSRQRFQPFTGVGGAMTDTSAWLIVDELSPANRDALMADLFGASGIHLGYLRVPIGASDFTALGQPYTYDDMPAGESDPTLSEFSIARDQPYVVPAIQEALALNPQLQISANPWSPPAWMKANDRLDDLGHSGVLLPSAYGPLAEYFVKFLEAYAGQGIPIAAITPQNEPGVPTGYPGMELSAPNEANFIANYLAPALRAAGLSPRIYGYDGSWGGYPWQLRAAAGSALAGIAWHCYVGAPWTMSFFHTHAPRLAQVLNECSPGPRPLATTEMAISSLRNWASAVVLWNLALDPQGGPVEVPNYTCAGCTGLATVDEQTGSFTLGLTYYQLGQVSRFVEPGARRIASTHFVNYAYLGPRTNLASSGLDDVAFRNPDGTKVLIAYNNSTRTRGFAVSDGGRYLRDWLGPGATLTLTWR